MNWKDIKTRRQLTQYLIAQIASEGEGSLLPNFNAPMFWTDEPVSQMEVAAAIRDGRRDAEGGSRESKGRRNSGQSTGAKKSARQRTQQNTASGAIVEQDERYFDIFRLAASRFEQLIAEYVISHPGYQYPPRTRHPSILALSTDIQGWLIDRLGKTNYLDKLIDAARYWFPPECDHREFRVFCVRFEGFANIGWGNLPEYRALGARYGAWRINISVRNRRRFLVDDLRRTQSENFAQDFAHLAIMCSRRYLSAARLRDMEKADIVRVSEIGLNERIQLGAVEWAAKELWERFVQLYDQPLQGDLFKGWPDAPDELWNRYFYRALVPALLLDDEIVQHLLNAVGVLETKLRGDACEELRRRFKEISMPSLAY